ncbi:dynein regulatory complex protein 11 isoform X2 [Eurosta solidaginis]|uniref:dynein regulatory complex protein 11 isoform X2 n=1 Tax=Eurosta solidaginis TaxID=178769 RepID=UPI00353088C4
MSFDFNYKFWIGTKKDIEDIIKRQNVLKKEKPISNPLVTYKIFAELYVLYAELVNNLSYVYKYTFQVQKREIVRTLVESATQRLIELKNELKNLELSEYVYVDKALTSRKLNPYDLLIWRSPQFLYRRPPEIQNIIYERKIFMTEDEKVLTDSKEKGFLCETVTLIQALERARSSRVYKSAMQYDKRNLKAIQGKKVQYIFKHRPDQPMSIPVKRTIFSSSFIKESENCQYLFGVDYLGIESEEGIDDIELNRIRNEAALKIQAAWRAHKSKKILRRRHIFKETLYGMRIKRKLVNPSQYLNSVVETYKNEQFKKKLDEDFLRLMSDERTRLLQERSPWIMEDISDHIRSWFREFYDKVGDFHPYPDALKTGTVLVLIDETFTPEEFKDKLNEMNLSKEEKKKRAAKAKLQKKREKEKIKKEKIKESKRRKKMKDQGIYDISDSIKSNKNIANIEKIIKRYSVEWRTIDEYLNKNHEAIKEWVTEGELAIIHKELRALVDEYMRTLGPAKGDIKMVAQECMLGLGEFTVDKPKSLCLAGPLNNGKTLLSHIMAFETDAVFINLSPENTQFFDGENVNYFMHVVMKVAKAFQPTIIFIQNVHRVFWKKIPKDQEYLKPRLLQKAIKTKILKHIKKNDRILLLGTTDAPWSANPKMRRIFQKVLLIQSCDYGTSFLLWLEILANYAGEDSVDDYVYSALAKVFKEYISGDTTDNISETLNVRRRMRLKSTPLSPFEFLQHFIGGEEPLFPPEEKLMEKYQKWYEKANKLCIARRMFLRKKEQKQNQKK